MLPRGPSKDDDALDEMYGASPPPDKGGGETETDGKGQSVDEENAEQGIVLVDKSKLPHEVKEGDICTFRVVKDFGDEVSLEYVKEGENEPPGGGETDNMSTEGREIAALDQKD